MGAISRHIGNRLNILKVDESNIDELAVGLSELRDSVLNQKNDPAYWRWCFLKNPNGRSNLIAAVRDGRVVGKVGNVYMRLSVHRQRVTVGQMEGLSVHPSERSWACLRDLFAMSLAERREDNLAFVFGFAVSLSAQLSKWLGGISLGQAPIYSGFLSTVRALEARHVPYPVSLIGWLAELILGLKTGKISYSDLELRWIENFDNAFDELWTAIERTRILAVVKDAKYLNWRYVECPGRHYKRLAAYRGERLEGLVVFRAVETTKNAYVLELLARDDDPQTMKALLFRTFQELKTQGTGIVTASFLKGSRAAAVLEELGFKSWGTRLWNMYIIISTDPRKASCPELELKNWDFSLGDWLYQ
jgi:hypothetical protein